MGGEKRLADLAAKVRAELPGWTVRSATIAAGDHLVREIDACGSAPFVVPIFMTDGWFTNTCLPKSMKGHPVNQLAPLGIHPDLPALTAQLLRTEAETNGWILEDSEVLLAAHGSATGVAASLSTERFAAALRQHMPGTRLRIGYLEQDPGIADIARRCGPKTLTLPFFAASGGHVTDDVPGELDAAGFTGARLEALGEARFIPALIADTLKGVARGRIAA